MAFLPQSRLSLSLSRSRSLARADSSTSICFRCAARLAQTPSLPRKSSNGGSSSSSSSSNSGGGTRRHFSAARSSRQAAAPLRLQEVDARYFWANDLWTSRADTTRADTTRPSQTKRPVSAGVADCQQRRGWAKDAAVATTSAAAAVTSSPDATWTGPATTAPQGRPAAATAGAASQDSPRPRARRKAASADSSAGGVLPDLPLDASAQLSALASAAPAMSLRRRLATYLALTKPRLAFLVVLTTTASYSLYPVPSLLSAAATHTPSLSSLTLLFLTTGTFGTIAAANTLNMLFEPAYDAQMSRTRNRPLVRGLVTKRAALLFAAASAVFGTTVLWYGVNPTTAVLGAGNIALYAFCYTPLKRRSVINTWVGAVVGAIPPLMGWCAAGGHYITTSSLSSSSSAAAAAASLGIWDEARALLFSDQAVGGWLLAALLFSWQFPHFNALSHPIRHEYAAAGYRMLVAANPARNTRVALRYSLAMFPICLGLSAANVTDPYFALTSSALNAWLARDAWRFWRSGGGESPAAAKSARGLFWASVWHLPLVLVLAMAQKKGLWDGVWRGLFGAAEDDDDDDDDDGEWEDDDGGDE
ncbi:hypothetical protein MBLNU459_g8140t1 [Dothideomycetes sp. NU459]